MNSTNNSIFFDTLQQFARDSSAGAAILSAVDDLLSHTPDFFPDEALEEENAKINLRWFAAQPAEVREQIIALTKAIQKFARQNGSKKHMQEAPALAHLEHLEIAAAMYRYLKKRKTAVNHIVEHAQIRTQAAYKAIVRSNLTLIKELRQRKDSRAWTTISRALHAVTGHKIPAASLSKIVAEVDAEAAKYSTMADHSAKPKIMTRWENDKVGEEMRAAYERAGYTIE